MSQSQRFAIKKALSRARRATKQGNTALALELYNTVLQQQPHHAIAIKGLRNLQKGSPGSQSEQAWTTNPSQGQIDALIKLTHSGQMARAEQVCRGLLQTYPQSLIVINVLGIALQGQGKLREAAQAFAKAIQLKPDYAEAYSNRGVALQGLGQLEEAAESYEKAIQLKPEFADAYSNRGVALRDLGQLEAAVESFGKAIRIKPDLADAYSHRGGCAKRPRAARGGCKEL